MALPSGTRYYIPITVDRTLMPSAMSNFPYQKDLSAWLAYYTVFKSYILTSDNVSIYDPTTDTTRPRIVFLNLSTNNLLIAFDGSTSTSIDKEFWVCVGPSVSDANSAASFTGSGYHSQLGINEQVSGPVTYDSTGVNNATVVSPAIIADLGKFYRGASLGSTGYLNCGDVTALNSVSSFGIEMMVRSGSYSGTKRLLRKYISDLNSLSVYWNSNTLTFYLANGNLSYATKAVTFSNNAWYHIFIVYNGAGIGNSERLKVYIDGVLQTLTFTNIIPATTGNMATANLTLGYSSNSWAGYMDEVGIISSIKDINFIQARYNQFFNFYFCTVGTGRYVDDISGDNQMRLGVGLSL